MVYRPMRYEVSRLAPLFLAVVILTGCSTSKRVEQEQHVITDVQEFNVEGIQVLLRQSATTPVVSGVLFIKGGIATLPENVTVATEYFAMEIAPASGSQRISKPYFRRKMLMMGSAIGGEQGRDYSAMSFHCVREAFDTSWQYFTDIITQPAFDTTEFRNLKQNAVLGLDNARNRADVYSKIIADSIYYQGHPYGRKLTVDDVKAVELSQVEAHYKSLMQKSRFLLSVVGNVSRAELTAKIRRDLAALPMGSFTMPTLPIPEKSFSPGAYFPKYDRALPTKYVLAYYRIPSMGDSDYYPYVRLRNFYGGFLFNHIRVQNNLAYAPNLDETNDRSPVGIITFETPYVDSAVQIVLNDADFFKENRIRQAAIRSGVARWTTSNYVKEETTSSQAVLLGQAKLLTGDWRNAFVSFNRLGSVSSEALLKAAQKYLKNFNWIVVGDTSGVNKELLLSQ